MFPFKETKKKSRKAQGEKIRSYFKINIVT